jgi:general secretion pathway protein A
MYEEYYGLSEPPFSLTPDPKYFYRSEAHNRAFELLKYGIQRREGFMMLYGDIGAGKTTICRAVLDTIERNISTALLLNPFLFEIDLLKGILEDFGVPYTATQAHNKRDLINILNQYLLSINEKGGRAVVLLDEAQNIPMATLEQLRILSNLETNKDKLLQIVFVGQLNLVDVISKPELRQLAQRISIKCELSTLSQHEVADYLRHRLAIAGGLPSRVSFAHDGAKEVFEYSGGIPRLINLIADRSLLAGMAQGVKAIGRNEVHEAIKTLQLQKPKPPSKFQKAGLFSMKQAAVVVALAVVLAAGFVVLINALNLFAFK